MSTVKYVDGHNVEWKNAEWDKKSMRKNVDWK
jgi:hypothetical protein